MGLSFHPLGLSQYHVTYYHIKILMGKKDVHRDNMGLQKLALDTIITVGTKEK